MRLNCRSPQDCPGHLGLQRMPLRPSHHWTSAAPACLNDKDHHLRFRNRRRHYRHCRRYCRSSWPAAPKPAALETRFPSLSSRAVSASCCSRRCRFGPRMRHPPGSGRRHNDHSPVEMSASTRKRPVPSPNHRRLRGTDRPGCTVIA